MAREVEPEGGAWPSTPPLDFSSVCLDLIGQIPKSRLQRERST